MINSGTTFTIDGLQMVVTEFKTAGSQYVVRCEPFINAPFVIKNETDNLMNELVNMKSKIDISIKIAEWFILCKAKLGQNVNLLPSLNKQLFARELRSIERNGDDWHCIIAILVYSFEDIFWKENLVKCYRNLSSNNTRSGIPIYQQLKNNLIALNKKDVDQEIFNSPHDESDL